MVHLLGVLLKDSVPAVWAFQKFYGIGKDTAERICARFQIHARAQVRDVTPTQLAQLSAFLSSPSTTPSMPTLPLAEPYFRPPARPTALLPPSEQDKQKWDPLKNLKIETELLREVRENIAHHRMIGSYVGRRHAMALPVRGQRTKSNAATAKKLNKTLRRG